MTFEELHKILDNKDFVLSLDEFSTVIYQLKLDCNRENIKAFNDHSYSQMRFYQGEENAFQICLDLIPHLYIPLSGIDNSYLHGSWSEKQVSYTDRFGDFHAGYQCSCCGAITLKSPYCGQCGAKMDL